MGAFDFRDGMQSVLRDGQYRMSPTAHALLWFLLYHGIYDRGSRWFSHVDIRVTSQKELSVATGRDTRSIRRGLAELEAEGFIQRHPRHNSEDGSRLTDDIELTYPHDFCSDCRRRGHDFTSCQGTPRTK